MAAPSSKAAAASADLTADQCTALLHELLALYAEPAFRAELLQARRGGASMLQLAPLLLRVQAPVLRKYSLPASAAGVELMKFAIHRRIAEGATHLERLANEARAAVGIAPMSDVRGQRAEVVLAGQRPDSARRGATVAEQVNDCDPRQAAELLASLEHAVQGRLMSATTAKALGSYLQGPPILPAGVGTCALHMARAGLPGASLRHVVAAELGCDPHRALSAVPLLTELPSAASFFAAHVLPSRPAVLRGVVGAAAFPPLADFPDFAYLRRRCGHRRVPVKSLALDDCEGRPVFVNDPEMKMPLGEYLAAIEASEETGRRCPFYLGKVQLRSELPELHDDLAAAGGNTPVTALAPACFGALHEGGVHTYFGCDRNVTPTHFDGFENLLVCLCGTKRLWLYPPSDARHLYCAGNSRREPSRAAAPPFQQWAELPQELRSAFPDVAHARPLEVQLRAGDFLYLPACWWHCVEGSRQRNMILNWWFAVHPTKRAHEGDLPHFSAVKSSVGAGVDVAS